MAIRQFLHDQSFDPERIRSMSWALEQVCNTLHVCDDKARETIATRIIELVQCGLHNGIELRDRVLREAKSGERNVPIVPWQHHQRL